VHAICEQYRAAATLDFEHDEADRGVRRIGCPVLALWSASGAIEAWYDPLEVWREWATDVRGRPVDAGHFLPEEARPPRSRMNCWPSARSDNATRRPSVRPARPRSFETFRVRVVRANARAIILARQLNRFCPGAVLIGDGQMADVRCPH
jgi:hypothetical protein